MKNDTLSSLVLSADVIEKEGIFVTKEIAQKTVWDELALENPTHAVISAKDETDAAAKSQNQIADIMQYVSKDSVLLDCGAGYGRVAKYLLPKQSLAGYIGVDSAYQMLKIFQQRYNLSDQEQETPLLLLNADIHTLPLVADSVDVAIVCAVFLHNHKEVVVRAVTDISRVVKPGGKVLVYSSFPRSATAMGVQGYLYQCLLNLLGKPYKNGPVRYYRGKEIKRLFKDFAEVELRPMGYNVLPKTLIFLPGFLEKIYRVGIANPVNKALESITPAKIKPIFAVHYDVIATR
jgi:ubiquinone/menaquinone biosynthesis C-methylase UbiE